MLSITKRTRARPRGRTVSLAKQKVGRNLRWFPNEILKDRAGDGREYLGS